MNYVEFGKENKDVIILLHGGGLSWWNYREAAEILSSDYHVVLPILDGHAKSDKDFMSIEDNADKIITFVDKHFGGSVLMMGGFSKLQFKSLRIKQDLFEDYFRDTCGISKPNMVAFLQANALYFMKTSIENCSAKVSIFVGEKENHKMRKSTEMIHEKVRGSSLTVLPQMYHGEFSINNADKYANKVLEIITNG